MIRTTSTLAAIVAVVAAASAHRLVAQDPPPPRSVLVPMADGVRIAVTIHLPIGAGDAHQVPALLELTRYWRAAEDADGRPLPALDDLDRALLGEDYAVVKIDVRGTGASFGSRRAEYGPDEVRDGNAIVDWVARQPWCDGKVGAYGTSYSGTTAELLAACGHPALRAVIPGWSDFDVYASPARPYGLHAAGLIDAWGAMTRRLDDGEVGSGRRPLRVDADADGALRTQAIAEHASNVDVAAAVAAAEFRDQPFGAGGPTLAQCTPRFWRQQIEAGAVPMLVFASWLDAGTAAGAIARLAEFANPQKVVILASCHGGFRHASPFASGAQPGPPVPSDAEQIRMRLAFFDRYLRGRDNGVDDWPRVQWFHLGEERMLAGPSWPPAGAKPRTWFLADQGDLVATPPTPGGDDYDVDFDVTTGRANRWATQLGLPVVLPRRERTDERVRTYTTAPLPADLHIIGEPQLVVTLSSDRDDGALLAYLEDVDPDGHSRYVTEGGLRLIHRPSGVPEPGAVLPAPTFAAADARPLVPGAATTVAFALQPTSMCFRKGHRLRLALAGADRDTFARVPAMGEVHLRFRWGGPAETASRLVLPVAPTPP